MRKPLVYLASLAAAAVLALGFAAPASANLTQPGASFPGGDVLLFASGNSSISTVTATFYVPNPVAVKSAAITVKANGSGAKTVNLKTSITNYAGSKGGKASGTLSAYKVPKGTTKVKVSYRITDTKGKTTNVSNEYRVYYKGAISFSNRTSGVTTAGNVMTATKTGSAKIKIPSSCSTPQVKVTEKSSSATRTYTYHPKSGSTVFIQSVVKGSATAKSTVYLRCNFTA